MRRLTFASITTLFIFFNSCSSDSDNNNENIPDTIEPSVSFTIAGFPDNSTSVPIVVSNQIEINIDAKDEGGISKIEAFINNDKVGEDTAAPYKIIVDISSLDSKSSTSSKFKDYTLKVTATDKSGNTQSKEQTINVDNEKPTITSVSLESGMVINSNENPVSFEVMDNEELNSVKAYLNDELLTEVALDNLEININTLDLVDGENKLKIEAIDSADNVGFFEVTFISDNTGPEINLESLNAGQILDVQVSLAPTIFDLYSNTTFTEILLDGNSIQTFQNSDTISLDFDPENYSVGEHQLQLIAEDDLGNTSLVEIPFEIYRRMIVINIPEDRLNPAITLPIVFLSRMDGSLLTFKEISREDRQITLSVPEEFDAATEFMVSFYLQDNGNAVGISTHQNLTRNNPGIINLPEYNRTRRGESESQYSAQVPIINFFSNDFILGQSGNNNSYSWDNSSSSYATYLNTSENILNISGAEIETTSESFSSFYLYDVANYKYLFINNPLDNGFILDKNDFTNDNVETKNLIVQSSISEANEYSNLLIFGAFSNEEKLNNNFHQIYHFTRSGNVGNPMQYAFNTVFPYYKHSFLFGKYYTERNGPPAENYNIPNVSLNYSNSNNLVNIDIQGTEHVLGRIECIDFDNLNYNWSITFNSQTTTDVVIPNLPQNISHPVVMMQRNGAIKVESVELLSYESIPEYRDYIDKVIKNQTNILDATEWYQLIYASRTGNYNRPIKEFIFQ